MTIADPTLKIDLSGLKCPLPVLKARRAIKDMAIGDLLEVTADDPAAQLDFPHFCETSGHELVDVMSSEQQDQIKFVFLIKVGAM